MPSFISFFVGCILLVLTTQGAARRIRAGLAGRSVLLEVEDVLGKDVRQRVEQKASKLEETLRHTFLSLPRNERGAVRKKSALYALHRLLVQLHGWQMKGLLMKSDDHKFSLKDAFDGRLLPDRLAVFFDDRLDVHGLDLHELSVVGALIENSVSQQAEARLNLTFEALKMTSRDNLQKDDAFRVMHTYLASYILGKEDGQVNSIQYILECKKLLERGAYPRWDAAQKLVRETFDKIVPAGNTIITDKQILAVLEEVADHIFELENAECGVIRNRLIDMESSAGSGRVTLVDFYRSTLDNFHASPFSETEDYLRQTGALDESDPNSKAVMIPNYVLLESNCLGSSGAYSVCCTDECEELMDKIESSIMAPTAAPAALIDLVSSMAPKSVPENSTVTPELRRRLEEVAEKTSGQVALHGRLFAQWMHHVYPRTCPFPHEAGALESIPAADMQVEATHADMKKHVEQYASNPKPSVSHNKGFGMWSHKEELVDSLAHEARQESGPGLWTSVLMFLGTLTGAAVTLAKMKPAVHPNKFD